jgi:UDP-2,3-diacylglucosamine hydrolase
MESNFMDAVRIGLIAGNGDFPILFLEEARKKNIDCVIIGLIGEADSRIEKFGYPVSWVNIGHLGKLIDAFKKENIKKAIMCGQVIHTKLFTEVKLDLKAIALLAKIKNKKTDTILDAVANELLNEGIELIPSITFMESFLPNQKGFWTKAKPSKNVLEDIEMGYDIAKIISGVDIGQTVVIKDKAVVAVESLEGTDKCILRGYELAGEGLTIVKVNKPKQDLRFDVPVIGLKTFETLVKVKASAIAFESGKTLFFDREKCLELSEKNKIAIYTR